MKSSLIIIGIILILAGIVVLGYQGFISYPTTEQLAKVGDVQLIANTQKVVYLPPLLGGLAILGGLALVIIGRRK